jgi:hypothetical protein
MAYDRADWHYGGDFPDGLSPENGATHIGMFLAWAILRNLDGDFHREESADALAAVRNPQMTGCEFLLSQCDEQFWEEDLNDDGNAFAQDYYATDRYFADYESTLGEGLPTLYHVEDTWENFEKIAAVLDQRYREWKSRQAG